MKTKKILLSSVCVTAMCASALAADLTPRPAPAYHAPPSVLAPQFSWTGCYVGGNAGWGHATRTWSGTATTPSTVFLSKGTSGDGFVGGGQLGCDYQAGNWVFGIEGMFDGSTINYSSSLSNILPGASLTDKVTSFETVTGRIGWAWDRSLFYVKGGGAWDQTSGSINGPPGFNSESHSANNSGWLLGGGLEYAFTPQLSAKIEYDYMGFGNKTLNFPLTTAGPVTFSHQTLQTVLVGLNYRFNFGAGPVGARY
jgi:outer membrane immunogenic protein